MLVIETVFPDVKIIEPKIFGDERGFFFESFNQKAFEEATGLFPAFVQDNQSKSTKGVLSGLHYQLPPKAKGKLVRLVQGAVFDVAVDISKRSLKFRQWVGEILSEKNQKQLWIPEGFAHGFITLSKTSELLYKTTGYYVLELERCIRWDDPEIAIGWPTDIEPTLSSKDARAVGLIVAEVFA